MASRSLIHHRGFSFINIFGLAAGLACSLLIFLFVKDEKSYDRFHQGSENIYRVVKDFVNDDGTRLPDATTPPALAPALQREIPEVEHITRVFPAWGRNFLFKYADKKITEEKLYRVDSSFFDVFTFPFIKGNAKDAFKELNSIIITESAAKRYFGNDDPMGKILQSELGDMAVTGVLKDVPLNSHFHFDLLISIRKLSGNIDGNWGFYNFYTYARLKPNSNIASFTKKIQDIYNKNNEEAPNIFYVQALSDIHLTSNLKWELEPNSDKLYVYIFTIIAIVILLIAGINYVNLATAKASVRAKEVGVRKVAGAFRSSLVNQFLIESVITCLIASGFAILIAELLMPAVNALTLKQLTVIGSPVALLYLLGVALSLGIMAGIFPALYLSSFRPVVVLKGFKLSAKRTFMNWIDAGFLQTLGIKSVAGRLFSPEFPADTNLRMILNVEAINKIGFKNAQDAIGKKVGIDWQGQTYWWEIVGVVKDFHFVDLHSVIEPYGFQLNNSQSFNYLIAHAKTGNTGSVLQTIADTWKRLNPNEPFEYTFLNDDFQKNYEADNRLAGIVQNFTIIAILISCLGLFGLATFSAEQRTKEIGVRKVLGASVGNVISLLSKEFLKLVFIAIMIASPITWLVMNKWLQDFAYRTNISWLVFAITAVIAISIALLTISFQAIKAALSNPVESLRTE
jgi:ABC-type antimicrobial peptide transport system permease subunit